MNERFIKQVVICLVIYSVGCVGKFSMKTQSENNSASTLSLVEKVSIPPRWVLSKGHLKYPSSHYLLGVGMSTNSVVSANDSARAELAKGLRVKIESTMMDISTERVVRITSQIQSQVETVLEGVEIKDGWFDSKVYYSLAVLNRAVAGNRIRNQFQQLVERIKVKLKQGDEATWLGLWRTGLNYYASGHDDAVLVPGLVRAFNIIIPGTSLDMYSVPTPQLLSSRIQHMAHDLRLSSVSGDRQVAKNLNGLNEPLIARVFKNSNGEPLPGIPVIFYYEDGGGQLLREGLTNSDGLVETTVRNIKGENIKNHRIGARIQYESLISGLDPEMRLSWLTPLLNKRVIFRYTLNNQEWGTEKSLAWKKGITNLVNHLIRGGSPSGHPSVGVLFFKDLRSDRPTPFSRILKEDFQSILVQSKDLMVRESSILNSRQETSGWARKERLKYFITGSYRLEKRGLEVRAQMTESKTGHVISSASVQIDRSEVHPDDLIALENSPMTQPLFTIEKRIATKPGNADDRSPSFQWNSMNFKKPSTQPLDSIQTRKKITSRKRLSIKSPFSPSIHYHSWNEKKDNSYSLLNKETQQLVDIKNRIKKKGILLDQERHLLKYQKEKLTSSNRKITKRTFFKGEKRLGDWIVYDNGAALDTRTDLMWMVRDYRNLEGHVPTSYDQVVLWVYKINRKRFAGFDDWRIPSIEEYEGIFDSGRTRLGLSFSEGINSLKQVMREKPVGYPEVFENGGGYWYWSNEEDSRCGKLMNAPRSCFRVFNFRDGNIGSRSVKGRDNITSSVRLVR